MAARDSEAEAGVNQAQWSRDASTVLELLRQAGEMGDRAVDVAIVLAEEDGELLALLTAS